MTSSRPSPSDLEPERVRSLLQTKRYGRSLRYLESTGSTNDDARFAIASGAPDGHVIVADSQRNGRGSRGNQWASPPGTDLYLSIVDRPILTPHRRPLISLAVGLGVAHAVEALVGTQIATLVKWPNDVWLGARKCAGILIESDSKAEAALAIGIGLNVNRRNWSGELVHTATSLVQATARSDDFDRAQVLSTLLKEVEHWVDLLVDFGPQPIVAALQERLALKGALVHCADIQGHFLGVSGQGAAQIATSGGIKEVVAGTLRTM